MLLGLLTVGITTSYLMLLRRSSQLRIGTLTGSSMEPALRGPRMELICSNCQSLNSWTLDAWDATQEVRCQVCREYLDTSHSAFKEGESVVYVPSLLWNKRTGTEPLRTQDTSPIRRWDMVVLEPMEGQSGQVGQVKRIVGLPGERIFIRQGRIWADGKQVVPTAKEFLHQAVVVANWQARPNALKLAEFMSGIRFPIDNELQVNAQDSHQRLAVQDIGIAFRLAKPEKNWNLYLVLRHGQQDLPIELSCYENTAEIHTAEISTGQTEGKLGRIGLIKPWKPVWINLLVLGNRLVVLDEQQERCSVELGPLQEGLGWTSLGLAEPEGLVDRCFVYRGLHYRGVRDSEEQDFQSADGWIVLGDNISISEDSRFWEQERVTVAKIRGILRHRPTLMEGLVKQLP